MVEAGFPLRKEPGRYSRWRFVTVLGLRKRRETMSKPRLQGAGSQWLRTLCRESVEVWKTTMTVNGASKPPVLVLLSLYEQRIQI